MAKEFFFKKDDDIIDIRYDNVFKAVFTRENKESRKALSGLVSSMIGRKISIIKIVSNEPPIDNTRDKHVRFDINCRAENGELVDVEMSYNPDPFEPVRLEYYSGKLFTGQDIKGKKKGYGHLKLSYQIAILDKEKFFSDSNFYHNFEYYDPVNKISLNGRSRIITIELSKIRKILNKSIKEMDSRESWAVFIRYLTDIRKRDKINQIVIKEGDIAMASKVVMRISKDEKERARLLSEEKYFLDMQSKLVYAEEKGIQKGEARGKQKIIDLLKSGKSPEDIIKQYGRK